jgi:hypothetical protein
MDETYRMLGREHEADLEREALKWRRAVEVRAQRRASAIAPSMQTRWKRGRFGAARLIAFVLRVARAAY